MSIGKRFVNLLKSNLNSIIDSTSSWDSPFGGKGAPIEDLSDEELELEMTRRKERREAADKAAENSRTRDQWGDSHRQDVSDAGRYRTAGYRSGSVPWTGSGPAGGPPGFDQRLARLYAQLEAPYGSDLQTVRKAYRKMMRKYHPDMHSRNPEKQHMATDLSQRLTMAYNDLVRLLSSH